MWVTFGEGAAFVGGVWIPGSYVSTGADGCTVEITGARSPACSAMPAPPLTNSQEQAIGSARDYLATSSFSRKGLIQQLSSAYGEGFSVLDATFAVDYLKVDWNEQAARSAKAYLEVSHFSRAGLIHQLESDAGEGFTHAQAVYGVKAAGL